jgi:hypothetical protein
MSITVGPYTFDGPHKSTDSLVDGAGVYAIHCYRDQRYYLVDVGESATVRTRVEGHDRQDCWRRNCNGALTVSVLYTPNLPQASRREVEQVIREQFAPCCGVY